MKNQWQTLYMRLNVNKVEQGEENMDSKMLDSKIEEFSTNLTSQFGNIFSEIKGMSELCSPGKYYILHNNYNNSYCYIEETEAEIIKRLQNLNAENQESIKQLEEVKHNCHKIKEFVEENYKI